MAELILFIAGIVWVIYQFCKESTIKPAPKGTDVRQVNIDLYSGKYTDKEINRRIQSGYYVKKDE